MWNLKVKGTDVVAYSQRFQELALMCDRTFPKEINKVERYVDGLPDTIHGSESFIRLLQMFWDSNSFGRKNSGDSDGGLIIRGGMGIGERVKVA
nr:reverse transcriptase domain-containing protein [Tanacetum cinerariifolium]